MRAQLAIGVGPVLTELLAGARSELAREMILAGFGAITYVETDARTWRLAGGLRRRLQAANQGIGFADTVVAALAIQHRLALYTLDRDFERIDELRLHSVDEARAT